MNPQQVLVLALQVSIMLTVFGLGLNATWQEATYLLRQPSLLARSVLSMSFIMPAVAILIAMAFSFPPEVEISLVALMLAPVPPLAHKRQLSAGGRPEFVVGLLVAMALLAIVTVPLSVAIIDAVFGRTVLLRPATVAKTMAMTVLLPLAAGLLIRQWIPAAQKAAGAILAIAGVLLAVAALVLLYGLWGLIKTYIGDGVVLLLAVMTLIGLAVGHLLGGPIAGDRTTLAIATAARHPALALAIVAATGAEKKSALAVILLYLVVSTLVTVPYQMWRKRGARVVS
jgi:bile acid:Na+ symporter, BASS family